MGIEKINNLKLDKPIHPRQCPSHIVLPVDAIEENTLYNLSCLNSVLEEVGVLLELKKHTEVGGYSCELLCITFNSETYIKKMTRNAGRKVEANNHGKYTECTVSELNELLKSKKHTEIIEYLKCSRSMFYKILKTLKECNDWENNPTSIWYYTTPHIPS